MTILDEIAQKRQQRIDREGFALGVEIPESRKQPLVPFCGLNGLICEIKRKSPSKGVINANLDPVAQAALYKESGAGNISVLTEEDYFGGSLADLIKVKEAHPEMAVLRKDFLLHTEDLDIAYRAGADAYLLIAALLSPEKLAELFHYGRELGMTPLVEIHNQAELESVAPLKPPFVGINCRDLKTFRLDRLAPIGLMGRIDWDCRVVYESGIFSAEEGRFFLSLGFSGLLVGEGVVRQKGLAAELARCFDEEPAAHYRFWKDLMMRKREGRPLVKVCGLTRREDAELAMKCGADMLGFILVPSSPRHTTVDFIRSLKDLEAIKIGVIILEEGEDLPKEIAQLLEEGCLQGIQFHGRETPDVLRRYPGYKVLNASSVEDLDRVKDFGPQPVLLDAYRPGMAGGTGTQVSKEILDKTQPPLWLAGGLNPENILEVLQEWHPHLVDLASGLEEAPGIKDPRKIHAFFKELDAYEAG